jgi:hypothetical protein
MKEVERLGRLASLVVASVLEARETGRHDWRKAFVNVLGLAIVSKPRSLPCTYPKDSGAGSSWNTQPSKSWAARLSIRPESQRRVKPVQWTVRAEGASPRFERVNRQIDSE